MKCSFFFKLSSRRKIDVYIGTLEENSLTDKYLASTQSYHTDSLTWCVQKAKQVPVYSKIFYLCNDPIVYAVFILQNTVLCIVCYYLQQFERPQWDYLGISFNGVCLFLGFPCPYQANNNANRVLFMSILLGGIIFVTTLSTIVIKLSTSPIYNTQIQTIDEIVDNYHFDLVGSPFALHELQQQNEVKCIFSYACI